MKSGYITKKEKLRGRSLPLGSAVKALTRKPRLPLATFIVATHTYMTTTNTNNNNQATGTFTKKTKQSRRAKRDTKVRNLTDYYMEGVPAEDRKVGNLLKTYKDQSSKEHRLVLDALKEFKNSIGVTKGNVAGYAFRKAGVNNYKELLAKLTQMGVSVANIPRNDIIDLVALDDWGAISAFALPMLKKFGLPVLQHLIKTYVKPRVDKWMGGDEGINSVDWGNSVGPRRFTPVQGENVEMPGVKSKSSMSGSFSTVDPKSIASTLCPELSKHRYSYLESMRTALAVSTFELSLVSNASGSVGMVYLPLNIFNSGSTYQTSYVSVYNDTTFSVVTGGQTPAGTFAAGPLNSASASIDNIRTTNCSIQVIPTASLTTTGSFTLGYNNRMSGIGITSTNTGTTLTQLKNFPFTTSFNSKTSARMINVTGDSQDEILVPTGTFNQHQYFVLFGSGLPAGVEVAKIILTATGEFIPNVSALPICVMDYPRPGPMTEQFESMMFMRFPVLQQLDLVDAQRIISSFPDGPVDFDVFFAHLEEALTGVVPRQYAPHTASLELALPGESVDFMIE